MGLFCFTSKTFVTAGTASKTPCGLEQNKHMMDRHFQLASGPVVFELVDYHKSTASPSSGKGHETHKLLEQ